MSWIEKSLGGLRNFFRMPFPGCLLDKSNFWLKLPIRTTSLSGIKSKKKTIHKQKLISLQEKYTFQSPCSLGRSFWKIKSRIYLCMPREIENHTTQVYNISKFYAWNIFLCHHMSFPKHRSLHKISIHPPEAQYPHNLRQLE